MSKIKESNLFDPYSIEIEESEKLSEILDYTDILAEIAKALKNYRKSNSLTQKQLANYLKVNQSMISKLESGEYNATFKMLLNISYALEKNSNLFIEVIENILKVLTVKYQYNYININNKYNYKIKNDKKDYYFYYFNNKDNKEEIIYNII